MQKNRNLSKWLLLAAFAASSMALAACGSDDETTDPTADAGTDTGSGEGTGEGSGTPAGETIVDVASAAGTFTTLLAAAEAAGLVETLSGDGTFTVFAPTDDAFAALPEGTVEGLLADPDALREILLYHVLPIEVPSSAVSPGFVATAADGLAAVIHLDDAGALSINGAAIVTTDVEASNGVIHVIDAVILPATIGELASYADGFSTLYTAVGAADPSVATALTDAAAELTVFAPTNDAFAAVPEETLNALLADQAGLTDVLLYHVFDGLVDASAATAAAGTSITMLNGDPAAVAAEGGGLTIDGAAIVATDVKATNGLIHAIGGVMLP